LLQTVQFPYRTFTVLISEACCDTEGKRGGVLKSKKGYNPLQAPRPGMRSLLTLEGLQGPFPGLDALHTMFKIYGTVERMSPSGGIPPPFRRNAGWVQVMVGVRIQRFVVCRIY